MAEVVAITETRGKHAIVYRTKGGATFLIGNVFEADKTSLPMDPDKLEKALNPADWVPWAKFCESFGIAPPPSVFSEPEKLAAAAIELFRAREERTRESARSEPPALALASE